MMQLCEPLDVKKLIMLFNYQYRTDKGTEFFNNSLRIIRSKKTGRIRYIYDGTILLATFKPVDGHLLLSNNGAKRFLKTVPKPKNRVVIHPDVEMEIAKGRNVYAKHVISNDEQIRPADEVFIVNNNDELLAIGRAVLNGEEMKQFTYGQAVKIRKGVGELYDAEEDES
jgi:7-cyano-7-deazaguanine tRNA-ribosyltransferase